MKTIHVAAAIIKKENKILTAKRNYGEFVDLWEFPGGKIEPKETPEEALKRELMEEMDITVDIHEHFITIEYDYPTFHLVMDCFLCSLQSNDITLRVHHSYRWVSIKDALNDLKWIPADVQIVQALQTKFGK